MSINSEATVSYLGGPNENLREELGIPDDAFVFGRIGRDDENIYEFVKTKSPSPAEVRSPKPWYKKSIGIFDKTKKSTAKSFNPASAVPVYSLTSSNQDDAKAKLVPNNIQPAVKTSTSKNDATALESFPKNYNAPSNPSQSQKYMVTSAIENAGTDKMSSNITSNNISPRPVSLLMSISDFDRQAAEIVSQRQKQEEAKQKALNDAFYISNESNASREKNRMIMLEIVCFSKYFLFVRIIKQDNLKTE